MLNVFDFYFKLVIFLLEKFVSQGLQKVQLVIVQEGYTFQVGLMGDEEVQRYIQSLLGIILRYMIFGDVKVIIFVEIRFIVKFFIY